MCLGAMGFRELSSPQVLNVGYILLMTIAKSLHQKMISKMGNNSKLPFFCCLFSLVFLFVCLFAFLSGNNALKKSVLSAKVEDKKPRPVYF